MNRAKILHLGDVVGDAGHQRARANLPDLRKGEGHDPAKTVLPHLVADVLARDMHEHVVERAAEPAEEHEDDHLKSDAPDDVQVSDPTAVCAEHAVIDDPAHQPRLDQIHQDLADHERRRDHGNMQVFSDI